MRLKVCNMFINLMAMSCCDQLRGASGSGSRINMGNQTSDAAKDVATNTYTHTS